MDDITTYLYKLRARSERLEAAAWLVIVLVVLVVVLKGLPL
jgi:hypothetical protein